MKNLKINRWYKILISLGIVVILAVLVFWVGGIMGHKTENNEGFEDISLPKGYSLESYTIEEVLETSCVKVSDCLTPGEYLVQSRCPFVSLCLNSKCAVVCPSFKEL